MALQRSNVTRVSRTFDLLHFFIMAHFDTFLACRINCLIAPGVFQLIQTALLHVFEYRVIGIMFIMIMKISIGLRECYNIRVTTTTTTTTITTLIIIIIIIIIIIVIILIIIIIVVVVIILILISERNIFSVLSVSIYK
jgi:hypothetical protein